MGMIPRQQLLRSWSDYYHRLPLPVAIAEATASSGLLRGRLVALGRFRGNRYREFSRRDLTLWLGMALGVHTQLLAHLQSPPKRFKLEGGGGE